MESQVFFHLIADYGHGDPAFGEVIQRLHSLLPQAYIYPTSVPAFDTLATGFWIYQYALGDHPSPMLIYSNTAPRKDKKEARKLNEGEGFLYAKLDNGVDVFAVNAGYCFSFLKPHIQEFKQVEVAVHGSQFRSRDFFPQAIINFLQGKKALGKDADLKLIPAVPDRRIAWIDGYGNLKTTLRASRLKLKAGSKLKIKINGVVRTALVTGGIFSVAEGELAFSPGSSGHTDRFYEIILRGGSAAGLFDNPKTSTSIQIS